nr:hypothetical protein CFP56_52806 [Quercus suber]
MAALIFAIGHLVGANTGSCHSCGLVVRGTTLHCDRSVVEMTGQAEKGEKLTSATDWTGKDDSGNPLNWPLWKKLYHTAIPTSIAFLWCAFMRPNSRMLC